MPSSPPRDFGVCDLISGMSRVYGCRGLSKTHCRALLHQVRIGRLLIKCPESALIDFKDKLLTVGKVSISLFLLLKVFKW